MSDLLDGQMSPQQEERAWEHVHGCELCRRHVEREGWVKTRLSALTGPAVADEEEAPLDLKGALRDTPPTGTPPTGTLPEEDARSARRRGTALVGSGAAGVCVLGVLALGTVPAYAPVPDRRDSSTDLADVTPEPTPDPLPTRPVPSESEDDDAGVGPVSLAPAPSAAVPSADPDGSALDPWHSDQQRRVKIGP